MKANWLEDIMKLMIQVMPLVAAAEFAFSGKPGSGEAKKQTVIAAISTGLSVYNQFNKNKLTGKQQTAVMDNAAELVDTTVKIMNSVDLFKKPDVTVVDPTPPVV